MRRLEVRPDWLASRNPDLETARSRVFRFAEHACVRAKQHQRHLASGRAVCVGGGISIRLAEDRRPLAIHNCRRNFLARQ